MDARNCLGQHGCDGDDTDVGALLEVWNRQCVGHYNLFNRSVIEDLRCVAGQDGMGYVAVDLSNAMPMQRLRGGDNRAAGADLVVDDQGRLAVNVPYQVRRLDLIHVVAGSHLFHDGQWGFQYVGRAARPLGVSCIGSNYDDIVVQLHLLEVSGQHRNRSQLIHRDIKEALYLARVEVDCQ